MTKRIELHYVKLQHWTYRLVEWEGNHIADVREAHEYKTLRMVCKLWLPTELKTMAAFNAARASTIGERDEFVFELTDGKWVLK